MSKKPYVSNLSTPKGRLKCFRCRVHTIAKNGGWHIADSQQVFLCNDCGILPVEKAPTLSKRTSVTAE
jgi:hypothetical protein